MALQCPFLTEAMVHYCAAFPIRKMIPSDDLKPDSACAGGTHEGCPVYKDSGGKKTIQLQLSEPKTDCVWQRQSIISFRLCTLDYQCHRCQFEQSLQDQNGRYEEPVEVIDAIDELRRLPGTERRCKYMLLSPVKKQACTHNYRCSDCPTYTNIRSAVSEDET